MTDPEGAGDALASVLVCMMGSTDPARLRKMLGLHGLFIVSEADRKVLHACAGLSEAMLQYDFTPPVSGPMMPYLEFARAELEARKTREK